MKDNEVGTLAYEFDDNGRPFIRKEIIKRVPRKTYIIGRLQGKYWGEIDETVNSLSSRERVYNFQIYEALVNLNQNEFCTCVQGLKKFCNGLHREVEGQFKMNRSFSFPLGKLPEHIICSIALDSKGSQLYNVMLRDIQFSNLEIERLLHQNDENEVFGCLSATISGHILDIKEECILEKEYIHEDEVLPPQVMYKPQSNKTLIETGAVEWNGDYKRKEFYFEDFQNTYWGNWEKSVPNNDAWLGGCSNIIFALIGIVFITAFLIYVLPYAIWFGIVFGAIYIFNQISSNIWKIIFAGIGLVLFVGFIISLISAYSEGEDLSRKIFSSENEATSKDLVTIIPEGVNDEKYTSLDTIYSISTNWTDWNNNNYNGIYTIKTSNLRSSIKNKINLQITPVNEPQYDALLSGIIRHDSLLLIDIYNMLDSIILVNKLNKVSAADMIVSFVQDFEFAILLPKECDPELYEDIKIKEWLNDPLVNCQENTKYGLYTPTELIFYQQADCDSRTVFIYILLTHFGIDACILSSEIYRHSLIGINLPYEGIKYVDENTQYVVWETTYSQMPPGVLSLGISNMDHWRMSLKSN